MKIIIIFLFMNLNSYAKTQKATFAGGCFWCMESPFEKLVGVQDVYSGFGGGDKVDPSYKEVASGRTKHREVVQVVYDDTLVSYERLLEIFWMNINPTDDGGQFVDRGFQYTSAIFYHDEKQRAQALVSVENLKRLDKYKTKIKTPILKYKNFYKAEDYHQDYYKKNIISRTKYKYYRLKSGRDAFLNKYWRDGDVFTAQVNPNKLKGQLSKEQWHITQEQGTERPFKNEFWNNKKEGIYVDIVSGEALFSSKDKFKSGTGWPSFSRPINANNIIEKSDDHLISKRIEVRSRKGNSHLGHVFKDGPGASGLRYCINSVALRFIPFNKLREQGFKIYESEFKRP